MYILYAPYRNIQISCRISYLIVHKICRNVKLMERFYCGYTKFYEAAPLYMPCGLEFVQIIQAVLPLWQHISLYLQNFGASRAVAGASRSPFREKSVARELFFLIFPYFFVFFSYFPAFFSNVRHSERRPPKNGLAAHTRPRPMAARMLCPLFAAHGPVLRFLRCGKAA